MAKRTSSEGTLPRTIYAQASPRSVGGVSLFDATAPVTSGTVAEFRSTREMVEKATEKLRRAGFRVLDASGPTINIAGARSTYERVFKTTLRAEERPVIKEGRRRDTATFVETEEPEMPGLIDTSRSSLADVVEGVAIEEPRFYFAGPSALAPRRRYWHLNVPGDVSLAVNADRVHRDGITGRGIKLVMADSGWFRHPYFVERGYRAAPVELGPAASRREHDEIGHGTGESANAFAVAPDIEFTMVKMNFVNMTGAFNRAVALGPDVISCSWGDDQRRGPLSAAQRALAASVAQAVASGIVVVFSAGNGHYGFPGQHPDVISAGGVYLKQDGSLRASNYSSGFVSNIYPRRRVPDVSGLVGQVPFAAYIMLPLEPEDLIDTDSSGGNHPAGDETRRDDGWAAFSGTSAAAPQIAGVCALIKQACAGLSPSEVRGILRQTARDVEEGTNAHREQARPGYDLATGYGLVNAAAAVRLAKRRCGP